jgi:hypothetical protein
MNLLRLKSIQLKIVLLLLSLLNLFYETTNSDMLHKRV